MFGASVAIATPTIGIGDRVERLDRLDSDEFHRLADIGRQVAVKQFSSDALDVGATHPEIDDSIEAYRVLAGDWEKSAHAVKYAGTLV